MSFNYDVFFSYRHRPLDGEITQKTFNALESYRLPKALREKGFQDIHRAFRDTEELPVSRILTDTIDNALHSTKCLVVVCSTDTPSSEWIDREVETFIEIGRADHIYPLLITGDPEHSFPPSLKLVPDVMDRVMDIRTPGNNVKKMMAKEETELLRVISGVTGCKETELLREHKLRRNRRLAARAGSAAAAFAVVAGVALGLMNLAQNYRDEAQRREQASMSILSELTYGLPTHLADVPGAYSRIAGILEQNTQDIEKILEMSTEKEKAAYEAAANYEKLANASSVLGQHDKALEAENVAIARFEALAQSGGNAEQKALASAWHNKGTLLNKAGRYAEADRAYETALTAYSEDSPDDRLTKAVWLFDTGANAVDQGRIERAEAAFEESLHLLSEAEESSEQLSTIAKTNYNYGVLCYRTGDYAAARVKLEAACDFYERLRSETGDSYLQDRKDHLKTMSTLATLLTDQGNFSEADAWYGKAIAEAEDLAQDEENTEFQEQLAVLYNNRAIFYNIQGDYKSADTCNIKAVEIRRELFEKTGSADDRAGLALYLLNTGENAFKLGDYPRSKQFFEQGLEEYAAALDVLGDYDRAQYHAWMSHYALIHLRDYPAALNYGLAGRELQPNNVLVNLNLAYACLYNGYYEDADNLLIQIAAIGAGQAETIRVDLEAQRRAGMSDEHHDVILALIDSIAG